MMIYLKKYSFLVFLNLFIVIFILSFFLISNLDLIIIQSNYEKISSILRTSTGDQDYWPTDNWLTTKPEKQGMNSKKLSEIYKYIEEEQVNIHSVIVVRNGYIVEEGYLSYYEVRDVKEDYSEEMHILYSVTKSITSLCIGVALKKGYIDNLSQTFFEFLPELWNPTYDQRKKNITIHHLLTMTSGIEWDESSNPYGSPGNDFTNMFYSTDWVQYYLDKPMEYDPGENFEYSGGSSMLLSALIQKVTNKTTSEFADENIFTPLGILENHWRWDYAPQGITEGASGLHMTPKDMAKIGLLCLNNCTWEGEEIVSWEYIVAATIDQQSPLSDSTYGYQFWIQWWFPYDAYAAIGYMGQCIVMFPEINMVIVFTANEMNYNYYLDYIIENFIITAIGVDSGITGYPIAIIWFIIIIGSLGTIYLVNKKRMSAKIHKKR